MSDSMEEELALLKEHRPAHLSEAARARIASLMLAPPPAPSSLRMPIALVVIAAIGAVLVATRPHGPPAPIVARAAVVELRTGSLSARGPVRVVGTRWYLDVESGGRCEVEAFDHDRVRVFAAEGRTQLIVEDALHVLEPGARWSNKIDEGVSVHQPVVAPIVPLPPAPKHVHVDVAPSLPEPPEAPSDADVLARAVSALRHDGDAARAMDMLDQLPATSSLRTEAVLVRIEALEALGRMTELDSLLERQDLDELPRASELWSLRAERRAHAARWREAASDFTRSIALDQTERALVGRASCELHLGDIASAKTDLEAAVREFPNGPRVNEARAALAHLL